MATTTTTNKKRRSGVPAKTRFGEESGVTTSKKIMIISYVITVILATMTIVLSIKGYDTTAISTITGLFVGEVSVSNAFYFRKAGKENAIKMALGVIKEFPDKADAVANVLNSLGGIS